MNYARRTCSADCSIGRKGKNASFLCFPRWDLDQYLVKGKTVTGARFIGPFRRRSAEIAGLFGEEKTVAKRAYFEDFQKTFFTDGLRMLDARYLSNHP